MKTRWPFFRGVYLNKLVKYIVIMAIKKDCVDVYMYMLRLRATNPFSKQSV